MVEIANVLTAVTPKLLSSGLMALREMAIMPRLVNSSYSEQAAERGASIDVSIPSAITVQTVPDFGSNVPPETAEVSPTKVTVPLDQWKEAPFRLSDKEILEAMDGILPMQASEAIKALANTVDSYILSYYYRFGGYHEPSTQGTPFNGTDTEDATQIRKVLTQQLAPLDNRHVVFDPAAEANALNLRPFQDASWSGDVSTIQQGRLNQKLGFQWWMDQNVPSHTAGSLTGTINVGAVEPIGETTIQLDTGAGEAINIKKGDVVKFSNHSTTYSAQADLTVGASSSGNLTINEPGLTAALATSDTIAIHGDNSGSHVANLAFHRDAFAFASRPLMREVSGLGSIMETAVDPVSGLALRLEVTREYKRTRWAYDILYGAEVPRPELGARLADTTA